MKKDKKDGIIVKNIQKTYSGRSVVFDVSVELKAGEVVGILGPNGAGKTTSFYMICGLVMADSGEIFIDGVDVTHMPMHTRAKHGLSYLPQESSIFQDLSVEDNLKLVLEFCIKEKQQRQDRLEELLHEFGLVQLRYAKAGGLSGGERRRTEVARCLASNPKYILLDEPFAGVDPISVDNVKNLIIKLKDKGIGVLLTDHNVYEILNVIERGYIISEGCVIAEGLPDELISNEEVKKVYLGESFTYNK